MSAPTHISYRDIHIHIYTHIQQVTELEAWLVVTLGTLEILSRLLVIRSQALQMLQVGSIDTASDIFAVKH